MTFILLESTKHSLHFDTRWQLTQLPHFTLNAVTALK